MQPAHIEKNFFEFHAWKNGGFIVGIDEVGRGCLAGPVVAGAVILPKNAPKRVLSKLLKDSKLMTPEEREKSYAWITKHCPIGVGIVHHRIIQSRNIWFATQSAMRKALFALLSGDMHDTMRKNIQAITVDAVPISLAGTAWGHLSVHHFPFGESKSSSVAAASIVAKVVRDRLMPHYDVLFPGYQFASHKGYGTKTHKDAIKLQGHSLSHRLSFLSNSLGAHFHCQTDGTHKVKSDERREQASIC